MPRSEQKNSGEVAILPIAEVAEDAEGSDGVVWRGSGDIAHLLRPLDRLHEDPANVNTHNERSIAGIAAAYARFGQQKPIVVDAHGVTRAGNGQLIAARRLGWTHIAASESSLTGSELTAYALADNRIAQHAEFDFEALAAQLKAMDEEGTPIDDLGWTDYELEPLLQANWTPPALAPGAGEGDYAGSIPHNGQQGGGGGDGDGSDLPTRPIELDPLQRATVNDAVQAMREINEEYAMTEGRCIQLICQAYLDRLDA
jgi:hypothetical protein